ncbi:MAG: acetate/propionate family kinase [Jatrophihabitantaceae bacterium]
MRVLTVNTGSSSVKTAVYDAAPELRAIKAASARQIETIAGFGAALRGLLPGLLSGLPTPAAVGHRLVVGGEAWWAPRVLDDAAVAALRKLAPEAPDHLPQALAAIAMTQELFPGVPQIACSDAAFHRTLPAAARAIAVPAWAGVEKCGFHGISCEHIVAVLQAEAAAAASAGGRLIIAHLGNGCSLTAVRGGHSVETTMGFSPLGGVAMSTRSGDLDPGVVVQMLRRRPLAAEELNRVLNRESGLLALSGTSGDMQTLLGEGTPAAAAAVEVFVYQARKAMGALAAVLGGCDLLVFTGGIGENAATVRSRILEGMEWLIPQSRVIAADEDRMIAQHVLERLNPR